MKIHVYILVGLMTSVSWFLPHDLQAHPVGEGVLFFEPLNVIPPEQIVEEVTVPMLRRTLPQLLDRFRREQWHDLVRGRMREGAPAVPLGEEAAPHEE